MSSFFRSQEMVYCQLMIPGEQGYEILNVLGELNSIHFIDGNRSEAEVSRKYGNHIKACTEVLFKLQLIRGEMQKRKLYIKPCTDFKGLVQNFNRNRNQTVNSIFSLDNDITSSYQKIQKQMSLLQDLKSQVASLREYEEVLYVVRQILGPNFFQARGNYNSQNVVGINFKEIKMNNIGVNYVTGIIDQDDFVTFRRMIFRVTKGNAWTGIEPVRQAEQDNNNHNDGDNLDKKMVFIVIFPGGELDILQGKIIRCCDSFNAQRFTFPHDEQEFNHKLMETKQNLQAAYSTLMNTEILLEQYLSSFSDVKDYICSEIEELIFYVQKEKKLFQTLNGFKQQGNQFDLQFCKCWVPAKQQEEVLSVIYNMQKNNHNITVQLQQISKKNQVEPTYIKTNKFTYAFQEIVNTYGIPRYQEANPGLFTIMTFPFLFGIMFGDIGHGSLLLIFGIYICLGKSSIQNDKNHTFYDMIPFRYLFLFMGIFATYCGFIYNDFMSLGLNLFNSCYEIVEGEAVRKDECVYIFGMDPVWSISDNDLQNANSFKMKLAVILGVIQMCVGIFLQASNAIYFKKPLDFFCEFVPRILFMSATFVYMNLLIIIKWTTDWTGRTELAPSIIGVMIGIPLNKGSPGDTPVYGDGIKQTNLQQLLLAIVFITIPWMLFPKPILLNKQMKKQQEGYQGVDAIHGSEKSILINQKKPLVDYDEQNKSDLINDLAKLKGQNMQQYDSEESEDDIIQHEDFGEIFVHQVIETIEFVLGSISNTASYLRLWALSLAHSQLAKVFFDKCLKGSLEAGVWWQLVISFYIFAILTAGVLMMMDVMECFLHALRLHWVEFQNKFYKADGYLFVPLSFSKTISSTEQ